MLRFSFGSLRVRLILLILISVIPALGITLYSSLKQREQARLNALEDALSTAKEISEIYERLIQNGRQILFTLSQISHVHQHDGPGASKIFADLMRQSQGYSGLIALKPNGDFFASDKPLENSIISTQRPPWVQRALEARDFVIGEYQVGRFSGKPIIVLAYPVLDSTGDIKAVLSIGLDLEWVNQTLVRSKISKGTSLSVIDSNGTILFRYPEPEKFMGKPMPEPSVAKTILSKREGVREAIDLAGVPRLFGFTSLGKGGESIHISVGIPKKIALIEIDRIMEQNLIFLGLIAVLAIIVAWLGGDLFFLRPVNRLLNITKCLSDGDLNARTGPPYGKGEIGELSRSFDWMAESLQRHEEERKRAEDEMNSTKARLEHLLTFSPAVIYSCEPHGDYGTTFVGKNIKTLLGHEPEEFIDDPKFWADHIHPEDAQPVFTNLFRLFEQNHYAHEYRFQHKDGSYIWIRDNLRLVRDTAGNPIEIVGSMTDITELKRAEEEGASLQEQLRQSQKMEAIGQLAGGIAHDFNNLLTIVNGYSGLSLLQLKEGDPLRENIDEIQKASNRASNLTRQISAFSRRQVMEMKVLDLNTLLRDLGKMLRRVIGEDVELVTVWAEDLGRVKADPGQIEQVIMNLAVNARDAMPSGGKLTIETANVELDEEYAHKHIAVTPGRYVMLSVSDTGVGMTPEVRERVFEPFFTTKEKGEGTGLGLSTVYGIVKQSGGNIWVYSEPGKGTTFKIYLPRVDEPLEELRKRVESRELPRGDETILVVEDDEKVRKLAVRILGKQGYKVLEASQGLDGFLICEEHKEPIHLLIIDIVMPRMSGHELAERIASIRPEIKVLYMSGYMDNAIVHHSLLGEGMDYIQKPFTVDGLARKVREVLDELS